MAGGGDCVFPADLRGFWLALTGECQCRKYPNKGVRPYMHADEYLPNGQPVGKPYPVEIELDYEIPEESD